MIGIGIGIPGGLEGLNLYGAHIDSLVTACDAGVSVGDAVGFSAADHFSQANAASGSVLKAVGFVVTKPSSTTCTVRFAGEYDGLSGLSAGDEYYLSAATAGAIVTSPPTGTGDIVQSLGFAKNTTTLVVSPDSTIRTN